MNKIKNVKHQMIAVMILQDGARYVFKAMNGKAGSVQLILSTP